MFNLFLFFAAEFTQIVVQLDNSHGFNEQCGAGGGLVVDHTLHLRTVFSLDRQAVAAVSHGDQVVLQFGTNILGRNHRCQL